MAALRTIKVFIASPGDLPVERRAFKDTIDALNKGYGRGAHVEFVPLGWEESPAIVSNRSQSVINQKIDDCDVFILTMWKRWGQEAPDAHPYSSYTEEEFYRALTLYERTGKPTIFVFFKHIAPALMADAGPQLSKVLAFRKKLEATRQVLYHGFANKNAFAAEIETHLIGFAETPLTLGPRAHLPILPDDTQAELDKQRAEIEKHRADNQKLVDEIETLKAEAKTATEEAKRAQAQARTFTEKSDADARIAAAKAASHALALAESAARAALDGRIEEARQNFAKALDGATDPRILSLGSAFFTRIGEHHEAVRLMQRVLACSGRESLTAETAGALYGLGRLAMARGNLDEAEMLHREALEINRELGLLEGQAMSLDQIGCIYVLRGKLDEAAKLLREAHDIFSRLPPSEWQAANTGNLGFYAWKKGDLNEAEKQIREAIEAFRKLGLWDGQATQIGNLGEIYEARENLDEAEKLYRESLGIFVTLGKLEGQANQLGNLGSIAKKRGNTAEARRLWTESRDLYARVGVPQEVKKVQDWLHSLPPE